MEFIFFILGVIIGIVIMWLYNKSTTMQGFIEVDHNNNQFNIMVSSGDVLKRRHKKAILKVVHNVDLSQDIQGL